MEMEVHDGRLVLRLPAVLDLPGSADLRDTLLDLLARDVAGDVVLKADAVERISTASVQVVLAAATAFRAAARRLEIEGASPAFIDSFRHLGVGAELDMIS
jgi:chemotaxis protein CheX